MHLEVLSRTETEQEMAGDKLTVAQLGERVDNHIRFFWVAVTAGFVWLAGLSSLLYTMNATVGRVEKAQADAPFKIVASLLKNQLTSREEAADNLGAVSAVLKSAQVMHVKPDTQTIVNAGSEITKAQQKYPDLAITWKATASFINYKSNALLTPSGTPDSAIGHPCESALGGFGWTFNNCEVNLEDLPLRSRVNGEEAAFTFRKCIVHYRGGPIPAKRMIFVDSLFQFQVERVPDPSGMIAMRQMAMSTTTSLGVTL